MLSRGYSLKDMSLDSEYEYETPRASRSSSSTKSSSSNENSAATPVMNKQEEDSYVLTYVGGGSQGSIFKAIVKSTNETIALKVVKMQNNLQKKFAISEVENLTRVTKGGCHPFIVCYYNYTIYDNKMLIEMEYVNGKTLTEWSKNYRADKYFNLLDGHLVHLTKDLAVALQYIHERNTIHRDIKPDNIMITPENTPKLVDFGLACQTGIRAGVPSCFGRSGTPVFMAREVIQEAVSYFASDMWSLGATIVNASTGMYCYVFPPGGNMQAIFQTIINQQPLILETPNRKLNDAVNSMLQVDLLKRPTAAEIVARLS